MSGPGCRAIPARRDLFGAASALLLVGTAAADAGKLAPDGDLLALIAEVEAIDREDDRLWDAAAELPGLSAEWTAWHDHTDATRPRWHALHAMIDATPAKRQTACARRRDTPFPWCPATRGRVPTRATRWRGPRCGT